MMFWGSNAWNIYLSDIPGWDMTGILGNLLVGGPFSPPMIHFWSDHPIATYSQFYTYTDQPMNNFSNCTFSNQVYDNEEDSITHPNHCYAYSYVLMKENATVQSYNYDGLWGPFSTNDGINPFVMLNFASWTQNVPYGLIENAQVFDPETMDASDLFPSGSDHHLWSRTQKIFSVDTEISQFIDPSGCASSSLIPIQNNFASLTDGNSNPIVFGWPETYGVETSETQESVTEIPSECSCNNWVAEEVTMYSSYNSCVDCCNTLETCFTFTNCQDPDDTFVAY